MSDFWEPWRAHYREIAFVVRALARQTRLLSIRRKLVDIANRYDQMANYVSLLESPAMQSVSCAAGLGVEAPARRQRRHRGSPIPPSPASPRCEHCRAQAGQPIEHLSRTALIRWPARH